MLLLWLLLAVVVCYKFPWLTLGLFYAWIFLMLSLLAFERQREQEREQTWSFYEFDYDTLARKIEATRGEGIHLYRFRRDIDDDFGKIIINKGNSHFSASVPELGEYQELLVINSRTMEVVKVIPDAVAFTISCDPTEFGAIKVKPGSYYIWMRSVGMRATLGNLVEARASRDPRVAFAFQTKRETILPEYSEENLRDFAIEFHHDNHNRFKLNEYNARERHIVPPSPYIKAYQLTGTLAQGEIGVIFFENSLMNSVYHSLSVNGAPVAIDLEDIPSFQNKHVIDADSDMKVVYTQFIFGDYAKKSAAKPFMARYSKARSHFADAE